MHLNQVFQNRTLKRLGWGWLCLLLLIGSLASADLAKEGLVLYLPLESENPLDWSADPTSIIVHGSLDATEGQFGSQALEFDGNNANRIEAVDADKLDGMTALTIEGWVLPRNLASHEGMSLVSKRNAFNDGDVYNLFIWTGQLVNGRVNGTNTTIGLSSTALQDDTWYHIALVFDGAGTAGEKIKLYLNGVEESSADHAASAVNTGASPVWIGELDAARGFAWDGILDEIGIWNVALTQEDIDQLQVKSKRQLFQGARAWKPVPENDADEVLIDADLAWAPGEFAGTHHVYFGTDYHDVNDAGLDDASGILVSEGQDPNTYDPGRLDFGQTYYWRIDEVNSTPDRDVHKGETWNFTTELFAYPVVPSAATASSQHIPAMGPEKTINGSGLNAMDQHGNTADHMWLTSATDTDRWIQFEFTKAQKLHEMLVWNSNQTIESLIGFGVKDVTIETSLDGFTWTSLADVPEFARASGSPDYTYNTTVDFGGVTAKFVKLTIDAAWGVFPQVGLSEIRFLAIPVYAQQPQPADGDAVVGVDTTLSWRAGREAGTHEVVLSADLAAVEAGTAVVGNPTENSLAPATLTYGAEYFWRVNEVNDTAETPRYEGDIWRFWAPDYLVIDDFEMYADEEFLEIWAFWADGYQNDDNGALVGNGNTGDRDVVYQGGQSMPIHYDNSGAAISEVTRNFSPPLDWNKGAPTILSLQVRGDAPAFIDGGDTLTVGGSGADIWDVADEFRFVYKTLNGDGSITAKVESLTHVNTWAKGGVMIRESLSAESSCAYTVTTGDEGVTFQYRTAAFINAASDSGTRDASWADQNEPVWVRVERLGDAFNGYMSLDGVTWTPSVSNPQTITMLPEVKIGFCVTSHDNNQSSTAVFSNVSTTGSVSGTWTPEVFGTGHPDNDAAPMYLIVKDANGGEKTLSHPDANVTISTNWAPWEIPLSDLASLNLRRIEEITIGIGEPGGSASGAQGTVYVDLLQVGTPYPPVEVEDPNAATVE